MASLLTVADTVAIGSIYRSRRGEAALRVLYNAALERLGVAYESRVVGTRLVDTHGLVIGPADAPPVVVLE